jgi:hypothetical protein
MMRTQDLPFGMEEKECHASVTSLHINCFKHLLKNAGIKHQPNSQHPTLVKLYQKYLACTNQNDDPSNMENVDKLVNVCDVIWISPNFALLLCLYPSNLKLYKTPLPWEHTKNINSPTLKKLKVLEQVYLVCLILIASELC